MSNRRPTIACFHLNSRAMATREGSASAAAELAAEMAALRARQEALRDELARRNAVDTDAAKRISATFDRLPEYIGKLQRVQQSMETLAARSSQMRARCHVLLPDQRSVQ